MGKRLFFRAAAALLILLFLLYAGPRVGAGTGESFYVKSRQLQAPDYVGTLTGINMLNVVQIQTVAIILILSYFIGNFQSAVLFSKRFLHDDVRKHGSGNPGATNALRLFLRGPIRQGGLPQGGGRDLSLRGRNHRPYPGVPGRALLAAPHGEPV